MLFAGRLSPPGRGEEMSAAANGFDGLQLVARIELPAHRGHMHFDDVALRLQVLVVHALGQ